MGSLFLSLLPVGVGNGLFSSLANGAKNLKNEWDTVGAFGGALGVIGGVVFLVMGMLKSRDKSRWYWASGVAFCLGAILLVTGGVGKIQGSFSDTWNEVFGLISFVGSGLPLPALL